MVALSAMVNSPHARGHEYPKGRNTRRAEIKKPRRTGVFHIRSEGLRHDLDVRSLLALGASRHFEADALVFLQGLEAAGVDCGEMCKEVFAAVIRGDEAKTFCIVKPLNSTRFHLVSYLSKKMSNMLHQSNFKEKGLPEVPQFKA